MRAAPFRVTLRGGAGWLSLHGAYSFWWLGPWATAGALPSDVDTRKLSTAADPAPESRVAVECFLHDQVLKVVRYAVSGRRRSLDLCTVWTHCPSKA